MEVDGNLKVTGTIEGTIKNDSLAQVIANLQAQIASLHAKVELLECQHSGIIPSGYCDCNYNVFDACGVCGGSYVEDDCYVTDIDGNTYEKLFFENQVWMAENLKVTHYNNGDAIPNITNNGDWYNMLTGAYGDYDNNPTNSETYGRLYNWFVVDDDRGVCPDGYHVPSDDEYKELEMYLGMSETEANLSWGWRGTNEGSKLAGNADLWNNGDLENNSEFGTSGFSAFPAGFRGNSYGGAYLSMGSLGFFWSSSVHNSQQAWMRKLDCNSSSVYRGTLSKPDGYSIRCLGD